MKRARQITLVLAIAWSFGLRLLNLRWAVSGNFPHLRMVVISSLISAVPIAALLLFTLLRPDAMQRVYWFLPLYFLASAVGSFVSRLDAEVTPVRIRLGFGLSAALPTLMLGVALWAFRPQAEQPAMADR